MNNSSRSLGEIIKSAVKKPLAYALIAGSAFFSGCQIAQVTYMNDLKEGKETPLLVKAAAEHRNYLDDVMPATMLGQWNLAYDSLKQVGSGLPSPFPTIEGIWGTVFHGVNGLVVPLTHPFSSKSRSEIFADEEEQGIVSPKHDGLAYGIDVAWSTPVGDTYRTLMSLFSSKSEPFIPRTWSEGGYLLKKAIMGLNEQEKSVLAKNECILKDDTLLRAGYAFPVIQHWWNINGTEHFLPEIPYVIIDAPRHAPGKGIKLQPSYLNGFDRSRIVMEKREIVVQEDRLHATIPFLYSAVLYPARDAAAIGAALYPLWKGGNSGGGKGFTGDIGGDTGGR